MIFAVVTTFWNRKPVTEFDVNSSGQLQNPVYSSGSGIIKDSGVGMPGAISFQGGYAWSYVPSGGWEEYAMYTPSTPPEDTPAGRYTSQ